MIRIPLRRRSLRDPQYRALQGLARIAAREAPQRPLDALQGVADLARELTDARHAALAIVDGEDNIEGFVASGLTVEQERKLKSAPLGHGLLGSMRKDGLSVRIDDLEAHNASFGFPPKHPEMKTLLGRPIWVAGALRGALYVTDRSGGDPFQDEDDETLAILAGHASRIIGGHWY